MSLISNRSSGSRSRNTNWKHKIIGKHTFCFWCYKLLTKTSATVDHLVPLSYGGKDDIDNAVLACCKCNHERGLVTEFITNIKERYTVDHVGWQKLFARFTVLRPLLTKWHLLHLKKCPEAAENVDALVNDFAKAV